MIFGRNKERKSVPISSEKEGRELCKERSGEISQIKMFNSNL